MDAYQGSVYDPVSLHKYLYANANPVMYVDPSGYYIEIIGNTVLNVEETAKQVSSYTRIFHTLVSVLFTVSTAITAGYALYEAIVEISQISTIVNGNYSQQTADYLLNEIIKGATGQLFDYEGVFYAYAQHIKIQVGNKVSNRYHIHHIVAQTSYKADIARRLLDKAGLNVEIPENKVALKEIFHAQVHTTLYYHLVNTSVGLAYDAYQMFEAKEKKAGRIKNTLLAIGAVLQAASEACP
jgi:hypothetical protein